MTIETITTKAFLFDMDGTLIDSTPAVLATWQVFAEKYDLDLTQVLKSSHGVRTADNLRRWCGIEDEDRLAEEAALFENMIVEEARRLQAVGEAGLVALPGVSPLLKQLPSHGWAVVTSATGLYTSAALPLAGVPVPENLITAEKVTNGKPHPEPYMLGASILSVEPKDCIVVEDAPSGIRAGVAAGSRVLAVCTSHTRQQLEGHGATWTVEDLRDLRVTPSEGGFVCHLGASRLS
ncbi:hypothetical protein EHS25_004634 [Saitozyma podzolica]|uniref:Uncharacterized protein n=1 Tax=Saitozyma podzolica TaxID=1890683 RepID=A0A427YUL2_9TREE|nr:hypothetical protein EHS25_004634 [Saitozyma podzolica]